MKLTQSEKLDQYVSLLFRCKICKLKSSTPNKKIYPDLLKSSLRSLTLKKKPKIASHFNINLHIAEFEKKEWICYRFEELVGWQHPARLRLLLP